MVRSITSKELCRIVPRIYGNNGACYIASPYLELEPVKSY